MTTPGIRLRHLAFHGPGKDVASVAFGAGLNVVYGASDTGKSFVVEAIDFMLGGKSALRDIQERVGYDRVLLGFETLSGEPYTLQRSTEGGGFRVYDGLQIELPPIEAPARVLADQHSEKSSENLSTFLLEHCGLAGKRVRRNKMGLTYSLSFRNLARLVIVDENEIIERRSPLSDGNFTADTPNFATFKLLLTGVDDSGLMTKDPRAPDTQSFDAQLGLLDQLLGDYKRRLQELTDDPENLGDQLERIEASLAQHSAHLEATESSFRLLVDRRRELRKKLEVGRDRRSEIESLIERFDLLDRHYVSDLGRLRGIQEGGTLFAILGQGPCPLCGADPSHHRLHEDSDANVEAVVLAAGSEIAKIELLRRELNETLDGLRREANRFDRRLPRVEEELQGVASNAEQIANPLSRMRTTYAQFADKRGQVREASSLLQTIRDIERRRSDLENGPSDGPESAVADGDLPAAVADEFAQRIEGILTAWHFPQARRVHFDSKSRDIVIAGKPRGATGKGLRAITHAAFSIGILEHCRARGTHHPGFVILDSPLLTYREPEGAEDDLRGTDLKDRFYAYLAAMANDQQVLVVENTDPPATIVTGPNVTFFSANPHEGRYGFFPGTPSALAKPDGASSPAEPETPA
jgi:predicted nuclease with TOPRIM domain